MEPLRSFLASVFTVADNASTAGAGCTDPRLWCSTLGQTSARYLKYTHKCMSEVPVVVLDILGSQTQLHRAPLFSYPIKGKVHDKKAYND